MSQTINGSSLVCVSAPVPVISAALIGVPQATVQAWLAAAQQVMQNFQTGAQAVVVEYAEGQGRRQVTYARADRVALMGWIVQLQAALGVRTRRAIGVRF